MKPKKLGRLTKCITCSEKIQDLKALDCQLCLQWVCQPCSGRSTELFEFLQDKDESMSILCKDCKLEIPTLREMKSIQQKQADLEDEINNIRNDVRETKTTVDGSKETQELQGSEINRHEAELKELFRRMEDMESKLVINTAGSEATDEGSYANIALRGRDQIQTIVRTQINEQSEIEKLKLNLVISGVSENLSDDEDKTNVLALLEQELDVTADVNKTERIGRPRIQKQGEDPPAPRLLKLHFVTQRSRKEVLSKATTLRRSNDEDIKKLVYIRPDLTKLQIEQSKNLRDLLRKTRTENTTKVYKIYRNEIIEVTPAAEAPPQRPEPQRPAPENTPANNVDT